MKIIISFFTNDPDVIKSGALYLQVAALIGPVYPVFFITSALFQALKKNGSNVVFCQNHTEVIEKLENMTTGNEVIITQGAGTTSDLARKISNL